MLDVNINTKNRTVSLQQNGNTITLTELEAKDLCKKIDTELYYKQDVIEYFKSDDCEYDEKTVLQNTKLLNMIIADYAELRFENNGGNTDSTMNYIECLDEAMDNYENELEPYKNIKKLHNAIKSALQQYSIENVDIMRNTENNTIDIIYHSRHNSFPIVNNVCSSELLQENIIDKIAEEYNIGYCW